MTTKKRNIRLDDTTIQAIRQSFSACFLKGDQLWLFGSRVIPNRKGGDIDLYIETHYPDPEDIMNAKLKFLVELDKKIEEQKIDVVIKYHNTDLLIYRIAKEEGVRLL